MINRAAVILKYKNPVVKLINETDPFNKDFKINLES